MRNIRLTIQYDGTNYSGWQSQTNSIAIQDIIEKAILKVLGERLRIMGAARTDAGVHAAGQIANFKTGSLLPVKNIKDGLNRNLPSDIVIKKAEDVNAAFHSQFNARRKLYRYSVSQENPIPPFYKDFVTRIPYNLNIRLMKKEAKALLGRHDFMSFQGSNSKRSSTIRRIYRIDIKRSGEVMHLDIEADGFLYNMARTIAGTLINAGRGSIKRGAIKKILIGKDRALAGKTAPAKGLSLIKVIY